MTIFPRANQNLWWGVWTLGPCGSMPPSPIGGHGSVCSHMASKAHNG